MCSFRSCQTRFEFLSQFRKVRNAFECFITQVQTRLPKTKCVWPMKINVICTVCQIRGLSALYGVQFPPTLCGRVGEAAPLLLNKRLNCNQELFLLLSLPSWVRYILVPVTRIELRQNKGECRVKKIFLRGREI